MIQLYRLFLLFFFLSLGVVNISIAQSITTANPSSANLGQTLTVSISGQSTSFGQGTSTTNIWFDQGSSTLIYPATTTVINSGQVDANFVFPNTLPLGLYNVNVLNSIDGQMTLPNGFSLNPNPNPPVILSVAPSTSVQGQTLTVTVSGQHTSFTQGTSTVNVWFNQGTSTLIQPNSVTVMNDTTISAGFTIPFNALLGNYDVNSSDDMDGQLKLSNGFLISNCTFSLTPSETNISSCHVSNDGTATVSSSGGTPPYTFSWSPSGQSTATITGLSVGTYSVMVNDANGCSATAFVTITQPAGISLTGTSTSCTCGNNNGTATVNPSGGTPSYTYYWSNGQSMQTITGLSAGNYSVTVTDANGCSNIDSVSIAASTAIVASFNAPNVCFNNQTSFTDQSTGTPTQWSWNFGNGNTSNIQNPSQTYANPGTYTVTLVATNGSGCKDSIYKTAVVNPIPVTNFNSMAVCLGNATCFSDLSSIPTGSVKMWSWNFGDPNSGASNISSLQNPCHTFTTAGSFTVIMTTTSDSGCQSTTALPATIDSSSVSLTMTKDTANPLLWYLQPTINGTAPFTYLWNFGDGNTSTLSTPTHNYAAAGHYAICLTITDAKGCSSSTCDSTYKQTSSGLIQNLIVLSPLTGIEENSVFVNKIFPTPANNNITISLNQFLKGELRITDITGRNVYTEKVNANNIQVNVSNLPVGYYTLSILSEAKILREKIMVVR